MLTKVAPKHQVMDQFAAVDGQIHVAGFTMMQISAMLDKKVFYVYSRDVIAAQVEKFRQQIPPRIKLHFAVKANPNPAVVNFLKPLVDGFDVASQKELLIAVQSGMSVADISFAGPGKTDAELLSAITLGATINCESITELARIEALGIAAGITPNVALRVNPAFELKASGMKMAGGAKPFGIDEELISEVLANCAKRAFKLRGFHIFCGSQNLKPEALIEAHQQTFALAVKLIAASPYPIESVNLGGDLVYLILPESNG
nr:hypothetical protein [Rheinheimera salexigens]